MYDQVSLLAKIHAGLAGCHTPACFHVAGDISFDTLFGRSNALAGRLLGDRSAVMIRGHKDASYLVAYWACLLAARPLIPIEPDLPLQRIRDVARTAQAGLMIVAGDIPPLQGSTGVEVLDITTFTEYAQDQVFVLRPCTDVAYLMFSSGTSGRPKGIQVRYDNLVEFIIWLRDDILAGAELRAVTGNVRYCFDVSLFELWTSWTKRIPISVLDHAEFINSQKYVERYGSHQAGLWVSTPSAIQLYLRDKTFNGDRLPDLRMFVFCGEILPKPLVIALHERFPGVRVINTYGPTECTVAVTSVETTTAHLSNTRSLPIGHPRAGCRLKLESGQLTIEGKAVVGCGYVALPEKQAVAFPAHDQYRTGDIASLGDDGNWYFHGRADREIKLQGVRVDLNEIEEHLRNLSHIEVAVMEPHVIRGSFRALNAYVSGPQSCSDLAQISEKMSADLPGYMVPRFWFGCSQMQVNHNTKLNRAEFINAAKGGDLHYVHD
jgi:D-alanine--poly(phosphoribitol) ligase subunit 1